MVSFSDIIFYILIFLSVYIQVFFLVTFLENRKKIITRNGETKLARYPAVTIVVPCWNEERTVYKTIRSLLNLNYPKDKVKIFLIDDGSTDSTWNIIRKFEKDSSIMAVAPSVTAHTPKSIIQNAQGAEYHMGVYLKKMLGFLGAINVTPGPLTIFKKRVFDELGPYRHGHNTEDMEIAYRMQKNH